MCIWELSTEKNWLETAVVRLQVGSIFATVICDGKESTARCAHSIRGPGYLGSVAASGFPIPMRNVSGLISSFEYKFCCCVRMSAAKELCRKRQNSLLITK